MSGVIFMQTKSNDARSICTLLVLEILCKVIKCTGTDP